MQYQERLFRQSHGYACDWGTAAYYAALALAAAGTEQSIEQQKYNAQAQGEQQNELTKANNEVAGLQMSQLRIQEGQQREAAARENEKARLASRKAQASAQVGADEGGVSGISVDALLGEYSMQLGQFKEASNRQLELNAQSTTAQLEAIRKGAQNNNLSINAPITGPQYAAEIIKFGGQALGATRDYRGGSFSSKKTVT